MLLKKVVHAMGWYEEGQPEELDGDTVLEVTFADGHTDLYKLEGIDQLTVHRFPDGMPTPASPLVYDDLRRR